MKNNLWFSKRTFKNCWTCKHLRRPEDLRGGLCWSPESFWWWVHQWCQWDIFRTHKAWTPRGGLRDLRRNQQVWYCSWTINVQTEDGVSYKEHWCVSVIVWDWNLRVKINCSFRTLLHVSSSTTTCSSTHSCWTGEHLYWSQIKPAEL